MENFIFSLYNGIFAVVFACFFVEMEKSNGVYLFLTMAVLSVIAILISLGICSMNISPWLGLIVFLLLILSLSRGFNVVAANSLFVNIGYSFVPLGLLVTCFKSPHSDIEKVASLTIDYWGKFQVTMIAITISIFFITYMEKEIASIVRWWRWRKNS